jgi:hypothetical protein
MQEYRPLLLADEDLYEAGIRINGDSPGNV